MCSGNVNVIGGKVLKGYEKREKGRHTFTGKLKDMGIGSICDKEMTMSMITKDISATGKCNFYVVKDFIISSINAMAFQVG